MNSARREWLVGLSSLSAGVILLGCNRGEPSQPTKTGGKTTKAEPEVTATEDLMREHGVLRRVLLVYQETASKLRNASVIPPGPLQRTAQLFRVFGEEYHEKKLEEAYIFPAVKKAGGAAAPYADNLNCTTSAGPRDNGLYPGKYKRIEDRWPQREDVCRSA